MLTSNSRPGTFGLASLMGYNNKPRTTLIRSISFNEEVYACMELLREDLRKDRAGFVNDVLEAVMGLAPHPELDVRRYRNMMDDPRFSAKLREVQEEIAEQRKTVLPRPKSSKRR